MKRRTPTPLQHPDSFHLQAAMGWLGLGDYLAANQELDQIEPKLRAHAEVLKVRHAVYAAAKSWEAAETIARTLCRLLPDESFGYLQLADSFHKRKQTENALLALLPAAEKFGKEWLIFYRLASYSAWLKDLDDAWDFFARAMAVGNEKQIKLMALDDPEMEPLWNEIAAG